MALTTLAAIKIALDIDDSSEDELLNQLWAEAEAGAIAYMGRGIESATFTNEYYNGTNRERLYLRTPVCTAASDIRVDANGYAGQNSDSFDAATQLTAGTDFFVESLEESESNRSCLIRIGGVWTRGVGNVRATYTAGYSTVPAEIPQAIHSLVARMREDSERGRPVMSERLGNYSYQLLSGGLSGGVSEGGILMSATAILDTYRLRSI